MEIVGILGSGFGLYGYAPALVELNKTVIVPNRYRAKIVSRDELQPYLPKIEFVKEIDVLEKSNYLIVARNPESQFDIVKNIRESKRHLFLEKPLASTLTDHKELYNTLISRNFSFSVAYLFLFTPWWQQIIQKFEIQPTSKVQINWIIARPTGWKLDIKSGGGIALFYGIHFVPLLISDKYNFQIWSNKSDDRSQKLILVNLKGGEIEIEILYGTKNSFQVFESQKSRSPFCIFSAESPFGPSPARGVRDPRVEFIKPYLAQYFTGLNSLSASASIESEAIKYRESISNTNSDLN